MEKRDLLGQLATRGGHLREDGAPFKIYRRKTRKTKAGRPVYRCYFQLWDSDAQAYSTAQSTGQTTRAAAETWPAAHLFRTP